MIAMFASATSNYVITPIRFFIGVEMPPLDGDASRAISAVTPLLFLLVPTGGRRLRRDIRYVALALLCIYVIFLLIERNRYVNIAFYVASSIQPTLLVAMMFNLIAEVDASAVKAKKTSATKSTRFQSFVSSLTVGSLVGSTISIVCGDSMPLGIIVTCCCLVAVLICLRRLDDDDSVRARMVHSRRRLLASSRTPTLLNIFTSSSLRTIAGYNFLYGVTTAVIDIGRSSSTTTTTDTRVDYATWNLLTSAIIWTLQGLFFHRDTHPLVALASTPLITLTGYGLLMTHATSRRADVLGTVWSARRIAMYAFVKQFRELAFVSAISNEQRRATKLAIDLAIPRIASFVTACMSTLTRMYFDQDAVRAMDAIAVACSLVWLLAARDLASLIASERTEV